MGYARPPTFLLQWLCWQLIKQLIIKQKQTRPALISVLYLTVHMDGQQQQQQQQQQVPLFSKMLWTTKQEQDIGMMPPPGTSLVPLRRSSTSLCSNDVVITSPPLSRSLLKQELVDENSQNSIIDPSEILPNVGRYRHISESSLDVHQGDSNLSMINENSMDMMNTQMSTNCNNNENSNMSMDNSMDHHQMTMSRSSQFDSMDESSNFMSNGNSEVSATAAVSAENLKVMDLTMKLPMATVPLTMAAMPDLSSTNAPSMATLRSFGVTGNMNMPTQSAQSVENYLTNIENKTAAVLLSNVSNAALVQSTTPFMNAHLLRDATNNEVPKRDGSDDGIVTPITSSERLDAIVNCAVDLIQKENVLLNGDVIMNPALSPMMATNISPNGAAQMSVSAKSPTISPTEVMLNGGQLSPNLMSNHMTTNSSNLLAVTEPEKAIILNAAADLLATTKKLNELQAIPDAAMPEILATATNNDVMNMTTRMPNGAGALYTTAANSGMAKTMVVTQQPPTGVVAMQETTGYAGVLNAATINGMVSEKKLEDVLQVSTTLASMSENDLIDIINPSCFDQV